MLTGEAVPVRKVSYSPAVDGLSYDPDVLKACTLYGGTSVAQVGRVAAGGQCVGARYCWRWHQLVQCQQRQQRQQRQQQQQQQQGQQAIPISSGLVSLPAPQVRPGGTERLALGVVCRTAFWTAKGQLMKSILFPRQHRQTFVGDALKFIAVMMMLGLLFYVWDVVALASYGAHAG